MVEDNKTTTTKRQLIDFRGYPSLQLELELSWQVGAKVDQYIEQDGAELGQAQYNLGLVECPLTFSN